MLSPLAGVAEATKLTGEVTVAPFSGAQTTTPADGGGEHACVVVPVPLSDAVCGLPLAESVTVSVPVRAPDCEGAKVTLTLQLAPAPRLAGQLLVSAKSPFAEIPLMVSAEPPLLVTVIDFAPLVLPTN